METRTPVAQELWELFDRVHSMMISLVEDELRLSGRQPKQRLDVLKAIDDLEPAIPARVAERLVREPHSVSTLLDRMVADGMLRRVKDMPVKNQVRLELTEPGQAMLALAGHLDVVERVFLPGYSPVDDVEKLKYLLRRISTRVTSEYRASRRKV